MISKALILLIAIVTCLGEALDVEEVTMWQKFVTLQVDRGRKQNFADSLINDITDLFLKARVEELARKASTEL